VARVRDEVVGRGKRAELLGRRSRVGVEERGRFAPPTEGARDGPAEEKFSVSANEPTVDRFSVA
jgi:hypothetical protein